MPSSAPHGLLARIRRPWWWIGAGVAGVCALGVASALNLLQRPAPQPAAKLYVADPFGDRLAVLALDTGRIVRFIPTGRLPHQLVATRDHRRLFVAEAGSQSISEIDLASDQVVKQRIVGSTPFNKAHGALGPAKMAAAASCKACHGQKIVGTFPAALTLSADERALWVASLKGGGVTTVQAKGLATIGQLNVTPLAPTRPSQVVVHPRNGDIYVLGRQAGPSGITPPEPWQITRDSEHTAGLGNSSISVYDPDFKTRKAFLEFPFGGAYGAIFAKDGAELYVACRGADRIAVMGTAPLRFLRAVATLSAPVDVTLADDETLLVACSGTDPGQIQFIDRQSGKFRQVLHVPPNPTLMARDPQSGLLYVAASGSDQIAEIDPRAERVTRTFKIGFYPAHMQVVPTVKL